MVVSQHTTLHGTQVDSLTTKNCFKQITFDPTDVLPQSSSCNNLIFTNQLNYVVDRGTYLYLSPNCHHQVTFCKLNLKIKYQKIKQ